jgi:hypothetical protein
LGFTLQGFPPTSKRIHGFPWLFRSYAFSSNPMA